MMNRLVLCALMLLVVPLVPCFADWAVDVETGIAANSSNRFRIPATGGTDVSLANGFNVRPQAFGRVRLTYQQDDRDTWSLLVAPFTATATGTVAQDVNFNGTVFPANTPLTVGYTFNSYRLTYRRTFQPDREFSWGIGFTAKIRDAAIQVQGGSQTSRNTNFGFVPLINLRADWRFAGDFGLQFEADALAAPQGRAEDVSIGLNYRAGNSTDIHVGYRVVEGGANVPSVFNFARIDYGFIGVEHRF